MKGDETGKDEGVLSSRNSGRSWPLAVEQALRWWVDEIRPFLPRYIVRAFSGREPIVARLRRTAECQPAPVQGLGTDTVSFTAEAPAEGFLWIDPALVYRRATEMPLVQAVGLRAALDYECQRLSPLSTDLIYWSWTIEARDFTNHILRATMFAVRRPIVDAAVRSAELAGLTILGLCTEFDESHISLGCYPRNRHFWSRLSRNRRNALLRAAVLFMLIILAIVSPLAKLQFADRAAERAVAVAQMRASRSEPQLAALRTLSDQIAAVNRQQGSPQLSVILSELTALIPDDAWLSRLDFDGRTLRLHGYAKRATSLLLVLSKAPELSGPRFVSPIIRDPLTKLEEFELEVDLRDATR